MSAWNEQYIALSADAQVKRLHNRVSGFRCYRVRVQAGEADATWADYDPTPELDALFAHARRTGEVYPLLDRLADTDLTPEVSAAIDAHLAAR